MTKKGLCVLLAALFLLLSLSACTAGGESKQVVLPIDSHPQYLDPQIIYQTGAKNIIANCFEALLSFDESGNIVPAACESYSVSDSGLVYTFVLRKDGNWRISSSAKKLIQSYYAQEHGEEAAKTMADNFDKRVTAHDFVFALRRALQPETKCPYAGSLMNIENAASVYGGKLSSDKLGLRAKDDYTLEIRLERKDNDFLSALTGSACMPCNEEFFEITRGHYGLSAQYMISNGPFYISTWSDTAITARRNDYYRNINGDETQKAAHVKPSSIYFSFNNEQETRASKLKDGTYAIAPLTKEQAQSYARGERYTVKSFSSGMLSLLFNQNDAFLKNAQIRKAICGVLDRKMFLQSEEQSLAQGVLPSACTASRSSYRQAAGAAEIPSLTAGAASRAFKAALSKLDKNDAELTVLCSQEYETAVRSAMQQWQSVFGAAFSVSVEVADAQTLLSRVESGDYQLALYEIRYTDITAANALMRYQSAGRENTVNYSSSAYDKLLSKISSAESESRRLSALKKAEQKLLDDCVIFPICESDVNYGIGKGVSGIIFSPTGEVAYYKNTLIQ